MNDKYMIVEIDSDGSIHAETFNLHGVDCVDEINKLMKDIAILSHEEKKPEFYQSKIKTQKTQVIKK